MKKKLGFVGLGAMGMPMANNLLKAGYEMYVCDINAEATKEVQNRGGHVLELPRDVAKASEVVMTMLPDSPDVEQVYMGEKGLLSGAHKDLILIDSSTIDAETIQIIGSEASKLGVNVLGAPVGGGIANATQGNLIMLVGGDESVMESCLDVLKTVGELVIYAGPLGAGKNLKLVNNLTTGIFTCLLAEGYSLAEGVGLDREKLFELLKGNMPRIFEFISRKIIERDFQPGFRTKLMRKDLGLALKMAQANNSALPFGALAKEMYQFAINQGLGDLDTTAVSSIYVEKVRKTHFKAQS